MHGAPKFDCLFWTAVLLLAVSGIYHFTACCDDNKFDNDNVIIRLAALQLRSQVSAAVRLARPVLGRHGGSGHLPRGLLLCCNPM